MPLPLLLLLKKLLMPLKRLLMKLLKLLKLLEPPKKKNQEVVV